MQCCRRIAGPTVSVRLRTRSQVANETLCALCMSRRHEGSRRIPNVGVESSFSWGAFVLPYYCGIRLQVKGVMPVSLRWDKSAMQKGERKQRKLSAHSLSHEVRGAKYYWRVRYCALDLARSPIVVSPLPLRLPSAERGRRVAYIASFG